MNMSGESIIMVLAGIILGRIAAILLNGKKISYPRNYKNFKKFIELAK